MIKVVKSLVKYNSGDQQAARGLLKITTVFTAGLGFVRRVSMATLFSAEIRFNWQRGDRKNDSPKAMSPLLFYAKPVSDKKVINC